MKRALISGYFAQAYISLIGIVLMPVYMGYLGAEGLGLIGLFMTIQAIFPLLDLGLSPVLSREMSRYRAGELDAEAIWFRLRTLERGFTLLALACVLIVVAMRHVIVDDWLQVDSLLPADVSSCLVMMVIAAALRWLAGIYRAVLVGLERQTWTNGIAMVLATVRSFGVLPVLAWHSSTVTMFFLFQALAGVLELAIYWRGAYCALPARPQLARASLGTGLREMWLTAGAMTFLTIIWILLNQVDKVILSRMLSLAEYGRYSLAVALAGGVMLLMTPISQALQPRITILAVEGRREALSDLYRLATQAAAALFLAAGGTVAIMAQPLLFAWIGDLEVAREVEPIVFWYGWANALVGLSSLPFMLQFAHGDLRMHVTGNVLLALVALPALATGAICYGPVGAGVALSSAMLLYLLFWIPKVHRQFFPEIQSGWYWRDVVPVLATVVGVLTLVAVVVPAPATREAAGVLSVGAGLAALAAGLTAGNRTRKVLRGELARVR